MSEYTNLVIRELSKSLIKKGGYFPPPPGMEGLSQADIIRGKLHPILRSMSDDEYNELLRKHVPKSYYEDAVSYDTIKEVIIEEEIKEAKEDIKELEKRAEELKKEEEIAESELLAINRDVKIYGDDILNLEEDLRKLGIELDNLLANINAIESLPAPTRKQIKKRDNYMKEYDRKKVRFDANKIIINNLKKSKKETSRKKQLLETKLEVIKNMEQTSIKDLEKKTKLIQKRTEKIEATKLKNKLKKEQKNLDKLNKIAKNLVVIR